MYEKMIGMELVGTANALRRVTFQDGYDSKTESDSPTSMQQWFLSFIWEQKEHDVYQKDLEAMFKIRRSTATEILKAMERKKLIIRIPCAEDKRSKKILLTETAKQICKENKLKIEMTEKKIVRGLSIEEIKTFFVILEKIQNNIENF